MGHIKSWWNLRKFVLKLSQQTLPPAPVYSFKTALPIYLALFLGYGNYQNLDCQDMKTHMQTLEGRAPGGRHPGRLNLSAHSKETTWFREYPSLVGYLQKLDAIDTFYPKNPSVIVTNYVDGSHNCVAGNANFALCCISDCISILRTYEQEVQEPHTTPEEVLRITKTMPFAVLTEDLIARLFNISQITGGRVHLHGQLFSEWLHVLLPYRCPWPKPRWTEEDLSHLFPDISAISGREVALESWYVESMRDLQRLLEDGMSREMQWSDEEMLPLVEEPPEIVAQCETSVFHLIVQIVVILAGLNDLIWLCQWWQLPEGREAKAKEEAILNESDCKSSAKSLPKSSARKESQQKAQKKTKGLSKGTGKDKACRIVEHAQGVDSDECGKAARQEDEARSTEELEEPSEDLAKLLRLEPEEEATGLVESQGRPPDELGSAMSKAAARVATSRAAAAAAVSALTELQAATAPEARSTRALEALYRVGRSLTRRKATDQPSWRCSTIPSAVEL